MRYTLLDAYAMSRDRLGNKLLLTMNEFLELYTHQHGVCAWSGQPLVGPNIALARIDRHGAHDLANLQLVTRWANSMRFSLAVSDFERVCRLVAEHQASSLAGTNQSILENRIIEH